MKKNWKTQTDNNFLNQLIDKIYLMKNPPLSIKTSNLKEEDFNPGVVIKFRWYQRLYNWIKKN